MKRKDYQRPTIQVVQLKHKCHILAGSNPEPTATIDDYEDGGSVWDQE